MLFFGLCWPSTITRAKIHEILIFPHYCRSVKGNLAMSRNYSQIRKEFWAMKAREGIRSDMILARLDGDPLRYWQARDRLAEAFPDLGNN